jgi:glycosyltransferase involved in cell wall biosynthesis
LRLNCALSELIYMSDLIVFSHLRWDFVYQRPQHLLSRFAAKRRVFFIEEPVRRDGPAGFDRSHPCAGVTVLRPHTPVEAAGFHDEQLAVLGGLLDGMVVAEFMQFPVVWFYTPMALPLLNHLRPSAVVYDCMDELSAFDFAPHQLRQRESALLKVADLVLTGGPSLYYAKRRHHTNVHCFPSAVDVEHFSPARLRHDLALTAQAQQLQGSIPTPRLGFFGVIDERLDLSLLSALAQAEPAWQIVMVGPVVKIDPTTLPRAANLHWLGQQPYAVLPELVAAWDVCLMPFALNAATRFISPTKTLEYMAAQKPVVSTAVRDVERLYGEVVRIGADTEAFIAHCREVLLEDAPAQQRSISAMRTSVAAYSWDNTAACIGGLVDKAVTAGHAQSPHDMSESASCPAALMRHQPWTLGLASVGGGRTGPAAAHEPPNTRNQATA